MQYVYLFQRFRPIMRAIIRRSARRRGATDARCTCGEEAASSNQKF